MNTERMNQLADFVETVPHCVDKSDHNHVAKEVEDISFVFNMMDIYESREGWSNAPDCGTRGCLLGSVLILKDIEDGKPTMRSPENVFALDAFKEAEEWLDVSEEEAETLFEPEPYELRIQSFYDNYNYNEITPQQVAEAVRKAIKHGPGFDHRIWDHLPEPKYDIEDYEQ